ncbi:MAG: glycosyltransferase [Candidatus Omnitrophota bacterium]
MVSENPAGTRGKKIIMNVLHITNMYPSAEKPYFGIFVKEQIESIKKAGINVEVRRVGRDSGGYLKTFKLWKEAEWADIIHCHFGHTGSASVPLKYIAKKPLVVSYCGGDIFGDVGYDNRYHLKGRITARINSLLSGCIDCAIVKSANMAGKVRSKRIEVIPNGVDMTLFREIPLDEARFKSGAGERGDKIILFLGQKKIPVKNFALFKEASAYAGPGLKCIELEGIPRDEVVYFMNSADVCVLTSRHEGSPNAVKEAMACARPIVSVDAGDVRGLIGNVEGCFVVPYEAREIGRAIAEALSYKRTASRDRIYDSGLDMESTARKIIDVYESLLKA